MKVGTNVPIDGFFFTAVAAELSKELINARIQSVHQPKSTDVLLGLRKPGETLHLLISTHPAAARIHLTARAFENPISPPAFCLLLRKHLIPGRIVDVRQPPFERVLQIVIEGYGSHGGRVERILTAEVMGRHSNLLLIDPGEGVVIDALKRIHGDANAYREIVPGRPYVPPPPQDKLDPRAATFEAFEDAIRHMGVQTSVDRAVQRAVMGLSPFAAREAALRAGVEPEKTRAELTENDMRSLWDVIRELVIAIDAGRSEPSRFMLGGKPEFWCFPSVVGKGDGASYNSAQQLLDRHFEAVDEEEAMRSLTQKIESALRQNRARIEKKMDRQRASIKEAGEAEKFRKAGDLLTANLYLLRGLPPGQTSIELDDFDTDAPPVTVELDPRLTASDNAQSYYRRYQRAKKTLEKAAEQLRHSESELAYLDSVESSLDLARTVADLEEVYDELVKEGYASEQTEQRGKKRAGAAPEPLRWRSSEGFEIAVGRNNKQNDRLTLHLARPNDLWLHTKEIPGAHVVVFSKGAEVSEVTIKEAAMLAALHSKARHSSNVPVDYTLCRHVRKPRGARPGMVIYDNHKTVYVTPDEGLAQRLKQG